MSFTPPSRLQTLGELSSPLSLAGLLIKSPALARQPRGQGQPVLCFPGIMTDDGATWIMRRYLNWLGYDAHPWRLGRNHGNSRVLNPRVVERVNQLHKQTGQQIHLIGWSMGGVLARHAAYKCPDQVAQVISLGTPVSGGPGNTVFAKTALRHGEDLNDLVKVVQKRNEREKIRVPVTNLYSKRDGIVSWRHCIDNFTPNADNIEVHCTHTAMGFSAEVLAILAQKLA